ncbi:MAG: T9SS C-terminal target domain-containing protein [Cytophagales bacterium]|nr:MAG: T9SS C-terminal target domain-containing protein [Cytophagales bacterium]
MKTSVRLFSIILLYQTFLGYGQSFAPLGATWVYNYSPLTFGSDQLRGQLTYTVTGEQEVNGRKCKVIVENLSGTYTQSGSKVNQNRGTHYVYEDDGKVYLYNKEALLGFYLLYDFTTGKNNSWYVYGSPYACMGSTDNLCEVKVDSLGIELTDNRQLKVQYVSPLNSGMGGEKYYYFSGGKIIQNIGNYGGFFPEPSGMVDYYQSGFLRCYTDALVGTIMLSSSCETPLLNSEADYLDHMSVITDHGKLLLTGIETSQLHLSIYNSQGFYVHESSVSSTDRRYEITIDKKWKTGIYFLKLNFSDGSQKIKKIILE